MSSFNDFCSEYFRRYFELHPIEAIYYGFEGYDHLLKDYSDETYQAEKAFVEESLKTLRQIRVRELDRDQVIDYALIEGRLTIQRYEHAKEDYRLKWPDTYLPVDAIYILTVRSTNDFAGNLLSRLNRTPSLIQQGTAKRRRPAANPARRWTEMAVASAKGGISFLDSLPNHPKVQSEVKDIAALHSAIDNAKNAINGFANFLEQDLLPRSRGVYAVGEEHYNLLLKKKHFLNYDAQSLLALGEDLFTKTKQELDAIPDQLALGNENG